MPMSARTIPGTQDQYGRGRAAVCVRGQTGTRTNAGRAITPFMFNEEGYRVGPYGFIVTRVLIWLQYAHDEEGREYPPANEFYRCSNTHDPDQDGFEDLYRQDFIHAISCVARRKLGRHHLDPYQCTAFRRGIVCYNTGKEERDPTLKLAMEYTSALGTIVFDESCRLRDLMEAQIGRNQYSTDVELERLDREADHAAERIRALEDKEADMERSLNALLELGQEQTEASTRAARGLGQLATCVLAQQNKIRAMEERMDAMREMILGLEHMAVNLIVVDEETMVETESSLGKELEIEENEVAVPILVPGRLVPIEEEIQVLPDKLVSTQVAFELAEEDRPPSYE